MSKTSKPNTSVFLPFAAKTDREMHSISTLHSATLDTCRVLALIQNLWMLYDRIKLLHLRIYAMENFKNSSSQLLCLLQRTKRSFCAIISVLFLCLLSYNSATMFFAKVPFPARNLQEQPSFSQETVAGESRKSFSVPSLTNLSPSVLFGIKKEVSVEKLKIHLPLASKNPNLVVFARNPTEPASFSWEVTEKSRKSFLFLLQLSFHLLHSFRSKKGSQLKIWKHICLFHIKIQT